MLRRHILLPLVLRMLRRRLLERVVLHLRLLLGRCGLLRWVRRLLRMRRRMLLTNLLRVVLRRELLLLHKVRWLLLILRVLRVRGHVLHGMLLNSMGRGRLLALLRRGLMRMLLRLRRWSLMLRRIGRRKRHSLTLHPFPIVLLLLLDEFRPLILHLAIDIHPLTIRIIPHHLPRRGTPRFLRPIPVQNARYTAASARGL